MEKVRSALAAFFQEKEGRAPDKKHSTLATLTRWALNTRDASNKGQRMPRDIEGYLLGPLPRAQEKKDAYQSSVPAMLPVIQEPLSNLITRIQKVYREKDERERRNVSSVQELCTRVITQTPGGVEQAHIDTALQEHFSKKVRISPKTMCEIASGRKPRHFPTFPIIAHIARKHDYPVSDTLRADWGKEYAKYLVRKNMSPLHRVLSAMIGEVATSQGDFCHNTLSLNGSELSRMLKSIDRGEPVQKEDLQPILLETGTGERPARRALVACMLRYHNRGLLGQELIRKTMQEWHKKRGKKQWTETPLDLPGLLPKEVQSRPLRSRIL